jgi:hypothetical protein
VLLTGTNPFLQSKGTGADSLLADDPDASMAGATSGAMSSGGAAAARRADRAARQPIERQQKAAGREAVKPTAGATLTQAIGTLPPPIGLAQIVGLALGAPEFQRR